jgi:hypothetical protein
MIVSLFLRPMGEARNSRSENSTFSVAESDGSSALGNSLHNFSFSEKMPEPFS